MNQDELKRLAAEAAIKEVEQLIDFESVIGVGTGSTVNFFIDALSTIKGKFDGAVSSSEESTRRLKEKGIPVYDLNSVNGIVVYVDGADEIDDQLQMIKGGGAALTREKIVAAIADKFICIADQSKQVSMLGTFPLPVEVIPMARSYVARQIVKIGGDPVYREGVVTDNGNVILDVYNLKIDTPIRMEERLNNIVGVVCNGFFAARPADQLLVATADGIVSRKR